MRRIATTSALAAACVLCMGARGCPGVEGRDPEGTFDKEVEAEVSFGPEHGSVDLVAARVRVEPDQDRIRGTFSLADDPVFLPGDGSTTHVYRLGWTAADGSPASVTYVVDRVGATVETRNATGDAVADVPLESTSLAMPQLTVTFDSYAPRARDDWDGDFALETAALDGAGREIVHDEVTIHGPRR